MCFRTRIYAAGLYVTSKANLMIKAPLVECDVSTLESVSSINEKTECLYSAAIATYWMQYQAYSASLKVPELFALFNCLHKCLK